MSAFNASERAYLLGERRLGRLATVGADGMPHAAPVMWSFNDEQDTIDITGYDFVTSKKFRDVARSGRAAIVIDDVVTMKPWHPRGVEVRGHADAITEPDALIRIHPDRVISWGLEPT